MAHAGKSGRRVVSAFMSHRLRARRRRRPPKTQWRKVSDQLQAAGCPSSQSCMDDAETDVLAYMAFPT